MKHICWSCITNQSSLHSYIPESVKPRLTLSSYLDFTRSVPCFPFRMLFLCFKSFILLLSEDTLKSTAVLCYMALLRACWCAARLKMSSFRMVYGTDGLDPRQECLNSLQRALALLYRGKGSCWEKQHVSTKWKLTWLHRSTIAQGEEAQLKRPL